MDQSGPKLAVACQIPILNRVAEWRGGVIMAGQRSHSGFGTNNLANHADGKAAVRKGVRLHADTD